MLCLVLISYSEALPYIERRAALPPLGLVTLAAMLPDHWDLRLIDMNVAPLRDCELLWADAVLTSTMVVQASSLAALVVRCNRLGVPVAAGGPYPSISPERLSGVDHVFVGEAEGAIAAFAEDLERGCARNLCIAPRVSLTLTAPLCRDSIFSIWKPTPPWRYSTRAGTRQSPDVPDGS